MEGYRIGIQADVAKDGESSAPLETPRIQQGSEVPTTRKPQLVELDAEHLERIAGLVPGGAQNIQDIYPLSPLQEGMLIDCLLNEQSDIYIFSTLFEFRSREQVELWIDALNRVIDRHDVLRTSIIWEQIPRPVQVIHRQARLWVSELKVDKTRDIVEQLKERMQPGRQQPMDLRRAPLIQLLVGDCSRENHWYALFQIHHLISDVPSLRVLIDEATAYLEGREQDLLEVENYRGYIAKRVANAQKEEGEATEFFGHKLGQVDEPTAPLGILNAHIDGARIEEATGLIAAGVAQQIRAQARRTGVSPARIFHAAWGLVVAHTSGRDDVVYGTALSVTRHGHAIQGYLGLTVNTLPLRLQLFGLTAVALVEHTHRELLDLVSHAYLPLVHAQRSSGVLSGPPLFTALLNYIRSNEAEWGSPVGVRVIARGEAPTNYPIAMSVRDRGESFLLIAHTDRRIDPRRLVGYLQTAVQSLVRALDEAPMTPALSLSILPESERQQLIGLFNATRVEYPNEKLVHELFEEQVQHTPDKVAVVYEGQSLMYAELNNRANQLAWYLREKGVGPDQLVGICVERSLEMVVGLLGIWKAGGAYLPLDPTYPAERLTYMLEDAAPKVLLTQERLRQRVASTKADVIVLDRQWEQIAREPEENQGTGALQAHHLAYVIYTSGSTGQPKGVMIEHASLLNYLHWARRAYRPEEGEGTVVASSLAFDATITGLYLPLLCGRAVTLVRDGQELEGLEAALREPRTWSLIKISPAHLAVLGQRWEREWPCRVRAFVIGGEALSPATVQRWQELSPQTRLINEYGPTETVVGCSSYEVPPQSKGLSQISIGQPIGNAQIYILDSRRQPVPIGVTGEIYIGGVGVGRGYLNRSELTAERFLKDPYSADPKARMYKSGDLGRWKADGTIEYLGRNDEQVKIRGFRIELGEIEAQLVRHAQVKAAVVIAREDVPGEKRLAAYVIAQETEVRPSVEELREHLKEVLPEYMVPGAFMVLERLPLTPNGKLDRRALPAPDLGAYVSRYYEAPQGEVEEILAGIWQGLLGVERVGRWDNFFELGGHSLMIVQLMERLRRVSLSTDIRRVFESPTLADLAGSLIHRAAAQFEIPANLIPAGCAVITPAMLSLVELEAKHIDQIVQAVPGGATNIQDIYPLAPLQEGILFHHLLDQRRGDAYVLPIVLSVASRERLQELITALQTVIDRHDILRTSILWERLPRSVQVVHRQATLPVEEIVLDQGRDPMEQIQEWIKPERQSLNLQQAPLMRLLISADPYCEQWFAVLQIHHITCDHVTAEAIASEVVSHLQERAQELPPSEPYRNHVAQVLAYAKAHDVESFFRNKLGDVDEPTAPFGFLDVHGGGSQIDDACEEVEPALAQQVRVQARRLGVSAATLFHAAWALVVAHTSGRDDVVFGSILLGRLQGSAGARRILGVFINTLPLRLRLRMTSVKELVEQTQRELVELLSHEQASLAVAQRCSGIVGSAPLFTVLFNYRHSARAFGAEWGDASGIRMRMYQERTNYPITLSVDDLGEGFTLNAQTDRRVQAQRVTGYLHMAVRSLVSALEEMPHTPALALSILPESERERVQKLFNATQVSYPQEKLIQELFEEQVKRTPDAVAVVYEGQSLSYAKLNARANQLARYLRGRGGRPNQLVAICVERSLEMAVGLLGIVKSGGAYVPLDPEYPAERLAYMLQDATPKVVLVQEKFAEQLSVTQTEVIALDEMLRKAAWESTEDLVSGGSGYSAADLVYVIYTSGSTGQPKGTAMTHRAMVNLIEWHRESFDDRDGLRVLQFAALSFDVAFQEIFSTLCVGGTLMLLDEWVRRDAQALAKFLSRHCIERLFVPPLMLQSLAESAQELSTLSWSLRDVITAGEQVRVSPEIASFFKGLEGGRLHNHYGPTETHVVTALTLAGDPDKWPVLPEIGRPIGNSKIYILDARQQPVPIGVVGEIHIGGTGIAQGYLNRPELTEQRFIPDPLSTDPHARLYKTGDLGKWQPDGTIEYVGRNDHQVKIRGFRIEPGEIEAQLRQHPQVKAAAVLAREDVPGEKRLVAYVIAQHAQTTPSAEDLREHLKGLLPEYMVPSAFVALEKLPLTPSGKLDRRALPAPDLDAYVSRQHEAPQGEVEEIVAEIWQGLLRLERVGRWDNFFELGGHSLLATQLIVRLRSLLSVEVPMRVLFEFPTLQQLSVQVDSLRRASLLDKLSDGRSGVQELINKVVSMPDSEVQQLIRELRAGARHD